MAIEQKNLKVIKQMFTAFDEGNIPAGIDAYAEDVDFQSQVTRTIQPEMPWSKPSHSRQEIASFFKELTERANLGKTETLWFTAQDDRVVVEGRNRGTAKSTGRSYEHDWIMVFTLRNGKIVRSRHYYDTADIVNALRS